MNLVNSIPIPTSMLTNAGALSGSYVLKESTMEYKELDSGGSSDHRFYSFQIRICANIILQSILFIFMFIDPFGIKQAWGPHSTAIHYTLNYMSEFCFLWTL
jgi:hypothetical protein